MSTSGDADRNIVTKNDTMRNTDVSVNPADADGDEVFDGGGEADSVSSRCCGRFGMWVPLSSLGVCLR